LTQPEIDAKLIALVKKFLTDLKKTRVLPAVQLDAHLTRDLGIDSIGRVELFLMIEESFSVYLPESLFIDAETIGDIAKAIPQKTTKLPQSVLEYTKPLEQTKFDPSHVKTLNELLKERATLEPDRAHIYLQDDQNQETIITYGELYQKAQKIGKGLYDLGLRPTQTVAIMLPTCEDFFTTFFGVLLAGGVPVPIYPPFRPDKIEEYALRETKILKNAEIQFLITFQQAEKLSGTLKIFIPSLKTVLTVDDLRHSQGRLPEYRPKADSPALIQYTSGSTSDPKGVLLSHNNLLANMRAVGKLIHITSSDFVVSWLPLYHDMGLIGTWLTSCYYALPVMIFSPLMFLIRPERWLWAIHSHRATFTAAPNFAYELCIRKIKPEMIQGLDLSSLRFTFNGAEAVNPKTIKNFVKKFEPYGFNPTALYPVYGLAESAVALLFPTPGEKFIIDKIERDPFEQHGKAIPSHDGKKTVEFVLSGKPIPDHEVRIVDDDHQPLPLRQVGNLEFRGPSSLQGYYNNPEATRKINHEGWWATGDLAYQTEQGFYITGRKKDLIIKAGRNLYPDEIEDITSTVEGVRKGCVIAFGATSPERGTEELIIVAETAQTQPKVKEKIRAEITERISITLGIPPDHIILTGPKTVPKTSSGKLQRSLCKTAYLKGKLTATRLPAWMQFSKLLFQALMLKTSSSLLFVLIILYNTYLYLIIGSFGLGLWLGVSLTPFRVRRKLVQVWCRLILRLAGIRLHCLFQSKGFENCPIIYVANHASYLDSIILMAVLPSEVTFVGKKELLDTFILSSFLKKLKYLTIERIDFAQSLKDTDEIIEHLEQKHCVVIFPEGTFTVAAGIRPFKLGAFKVAVNTKTPICPCVLKGTRRILRSGSALFKPGKVQVTICEPIIPIAQNWDEITRLHGLTREIMVKYSGEVALDF
ncbi:MAG TPA: AMP-binding protein, partial [Gammaproteobacteria bacterium]|nr:AMP-binding protein [Gammaproteobacteria bacterium]